MPKARVSICMHCLSLAKTTDKAVAKIDLSVLKKCSVYARAFGCYLRGDALAYNQVSLGRVLHECTSVVSFKCSSD